MIRFNCPHCDRAYEVPDALARLPLVCKQCGQPITPPMPTPNAPAPPPPAAVPPPPKPMKAVPAKPQAAAAAAPVAPAAVKSEPAPSAPLPAELNGEHTPAPAPDADSDDSVAEINLDLLPKPAPPPPPRPAPPPPEEPPEAKSEPTLLPFVADLAVFVVLVLVGLLLGEQLVGKPTGQVISEAGAAPKFPPVDLLLWGGPALVFGLIYLLLNSRELTLGAWLRRRNAKAE